MAGNCHLLSQVYPLLRKEACETNSKYVFSRQQCHQAFEQKGIASWTKHFSTVENKIGPFLKSDLMSLWKPRFQTWRVQLLGFMTGSVPAMIFHLCCIHGQPVPPYFLFLVPFFDVILKFVISDLHFSQLDCGG